MDFIDLRVKVQQLSHVDVGPHLDQFIEATPKGTPEAFLAYLRQKDVIDVDVFKKLHTEDAVDATATAVHDVEAFGSRSTRLAQGSTIIMEPKGSEAAPASDGAEPDHYEVLGELGKGAMGEVHLARDLLLRRKVALKSILPAMQQNAALFGRFLGEMQITAQLDHPFIVPVYGVENGPNGGLAYAMKLVQGQELEVLLRETKAALGAGKPLDGLHSLEGRLETFLKVCDAMAYAHERGVVHRDLKPANIMIGRFNEVYVMDWGIARIMGKRGAAQDQAVELRDAEGNDATHATRTRIGSTIGTPIYMSPEQAAGMNEELDGRSDLYALGLILQEIVTLAQARGGTTLQEVLTNAKDGRRRPAEPAAAGAVVPREIQAIIEKATQLDPAKRYANVTALADDVRRYLRNEAVAAQPDTVTQGAGRWISKHRMTTAAIVLLALLLGAGATIGVLVYNHTKLEAKHNRELRLAELQASSSMRAQELDATLQHYEKLLARMAGAAGLALGETHASEAVLHPSDHFQAGPNAVSGLVDSAYYGKKVSFDWPVGAVAPDAEPDAVTKNIASINALRAMARGIMLESLGPSFSSMSDEERIRALAETGTPITRVLLTLESGVHVEYPGMEGLAPDFDGRKAPLYQRAKASSSVVWGPPVPGPKGSMVLPCATALRDGDGRLVGVVTFLVDPSRAMAAAIDAGNTQQIETSLLVERTGRVLTQSSKDGAAKEPEVLGMNAVKDAISRGETGYLETKRDGHDVLVTYQPLSSLDWYLVTIASVEKMESSSAVEGPRPGSVAAPTAKAVATASPKAAPPLPTASPEPTEEPSAEPSASAAESAEPPEPSASAPKLWGKLPTATATASAPPPPPPNPFDPWKAYDKNKPQ